MLASSLNTLQQRLLENFQHNLPLSPTPYAAMAEQLGVDEAQVIAALNDLRDKKVISRIGPVFKPHRIGTSTLAAMSVAKQDLSATAAFINSLPEVNHNYAREHQYNLWFVLTATDDAHLRAVISTIENKTGISVMSLPMLHEFHIDLGFELNHS